MRNGWRAAAVVTMAAGTLMLLIVGLLAVDIPRCHASVEQYGGLDLCDLGWYIAAAVCILIGIVWMMALGVIGLVALRRRRRRPPPSD